ncbi:MAG: hypothetical protein LUE98_09500 [Tannerellaceae bacterium]|nr:hypothetical protein [Tannerellaceae bacterium]
MIKKTFTCLFMVLLFLSACVQRNNCTQGTETKIIAMKDSLSQDSGLPQFPKEKQVSYIVHMNTKTPYELYLDDILIEWQNESGFSEYKNRLI